MTSSDQAITSACIAYMNDRMIVLPKKFIELLGCNDSTYILIVFSHDKRMLRLIPSGPDIIKLTISMVELPETVASVAEILAEADMNTLFSTGMCYKENDCVWEGYIDTSSSDVPLEDLRERIETLDGILSVEFELVEVMHTGRPSRQIIHR